MSRLDCEHNGIKRDIVASGKLLILRSQNRSVFETFSDKNRKLPQNVVYQAFSFHKLASCIFLDLFLL